MPGPERPVAPAAQALPPTLSGGAAPADTPPPLPQEDAPPATEKPREDTSAFTDAIDRRVSILETKIAMFDRRIDALDPSQQAAAREKLILVRQRKGTVEKQRAALGTASSKDEVTTYKLIIPKFLGEAEKIANELDAMLPAPPPPGAEPTGEETNPPPVPPDDSGVMPPDDNGLTPPPATPPPSTIARATETAAGAPPAASPGTKLTPVSPVPPALAPPSSPTARLILPLGLGALILLGVIFWLAREKWRLEQLAAEQARLHSSSLRELETLTLTALSDGSRLRAQPEDLLDRCLGYSPAELKAKSLPDLVTPETRRELEDVIAELARARPALPRTVKVDLVAADGGILPAVAELHGLPRQPGEPHEMQCRLPGLGLRVRALRKSAQVDALFAGLPGTALLLEDETGRVRRVNEEFCRLFNTQAAPGKLAGRPARGPGGVFQEAHHPLNDPAQAEALAAAAGASPAADEITLRGGLILRRVCTPVRFGGNGPRIARLWAFHETEAPRRREAISNHFQPTEAKAAWTEQEVKAEDWFPPGTQPLVQSHFDGFAYRNAYGETKAGPPGWRLAGATRRGRSHAHNGTYREDAFRCLAGEHYAVLCVSDGAGSGKFSRIGSELVCRLVADQLAARLGAMHAILAPAPAATLQHAVGTEMGQASYQACVTLHNLAKQAGCEVRDFYCTFLLAVLYLGEQAETLLTQQVGDGFFALRQTDGSAARHDKGDSGQYSGQVSCFVPDNAAIEKLGQIRPLPVAQIDSLILATDGVEDAFFPIESNAGLIFRQLYEGVSEPAPGFDRQPPQGPALGLDAEGEALGKWLEFEKRGENDDRTVLVLHRVPGTSPA